MLGKLKKINKYLILAAVLPSILYGLLKYCAEPIAYANSTLAAKIILDAAICHLQSIGLLETKRAHFSQKYDETLDKYRCRLTSNKKILNQSLNSDLIVVSDLGGVVERIDKDGYVKWRSFFANPRGVSRNGSSVFVGDINHLYVVSVEDGSVLRSYTFPFVISKVRVEDGKLWIMTNEKKSSIFIYEKNDHLEKTRVIKNVGQYARDFNFDTEFIYVADTFNNKVSKFLKATGEFVDSLDSYYPNSISIVGEQSVLVAEEHNNAIANFNFKNMSRILVHSCDTGVDIVNLNKLVIEGNKSIVGDDDSPCRIANGDYYSKKIFSPNDAVKTDDGIYIADTDNHRIVYLDKINKKESYLYDFNSPVGILVLK